MKNSLLPFIALFVITTSLCRAQTNALSSQTATGWTITHPFEHHVFIENKGQFTEEEKNLIKQPILYYNKLGKVQLYFSASSLTFRNDTVVKPDNDNDQHQPEDPDLEKDLKTIPRLLTMTWQNANPNAQIEVQEPEKDYFTYSNPADRTRRSGIIAHAWRKLIYHDLYNNIDVEFYYPEKGGIEYNIIVHPGADISQVTVSFGGVTKMVNHGNDIVVMSPCSNLTIHAPAAKDERGNIVATSFSVNGNTVSFKTADYDKTQTLTIDPWITNPNFFVYNVAYDVNYDNRGNVYVGGGLAPYELQQYDSSGTLNWSYSLVSINPGSMNYWGDFTVDVRSGTSYAVRGLGGYNDYLNAVKINNAGIPLVIDSDPGNYYVELWRVAFDYIHNQLVCAGGLYYPVTRMDTNFTSIQHTVMMDSAPPFIEAHDMFLLSLDGQGNAYMATNESSFAVDTIDNNYLFKLSLPTCSPIKFRTKDGYKFVELISLFYYPVQPNGSYGYANGFNGIASNKNMVVTYDGASLKKRSTANGALRDSINVTGTSFQWGGLDLDCAGDIYVGDNNTIRVYDSSFNFLSSIPVNNTIFSLKVGNGKLYACGYQFVQSITIPAGINPVIIAAANPASYCTGGSATLTASGGNNYTWSPATGLSATTGATVTANPTATTTYTVIGTGSCGTDTTTIVVTVTSTFALTLSPPPIVCSGDSATLTTSGGVSYTWSPSSGLNTTTGDSVTAGPSATVTYTVTGVNSSGCSGIDSVIVTVVPSPNKPSFIQHGDTLISSSRYDNQWYRNDSILVNDTSRYLIITALGQYWVIVNNEANGCSTTSDSMIISTTTEINRLTAESRELSVYPNPFSEQLTVISNQLPIDEIDIVNELGQVLLKVPFRGFGGEIDLSNLSNGMYFITALTKTGRAVVPVVKQ